MSVTASTYGELFSAFHRRKNGGRCLNGAGVLSYSFVPDLFWGGDTFSVGKKAIPKSYNSVLPQIRSALSESDSLEEAEKKIDDGLKGAFRAYASRLGSGRAKADRALVSYLKSETARRVARDYMEIAAPVMNSDPLFLDEAFGEVRFRIGELKSKKVPRRMRYARLKWVEGLENYVDHLEGALSDDEFVVNLGLLSDSLASGGGYAGKRPERKASRKKKLLALGAVGFVLWNTSVFPALKTLRDSLYGGPLGGRPYRPMGSQSEESDDDGGGGGSYDTDGDGLPDDKENEIGTDPNKWDTDGDGLSDGKEWNDFFTDPLRKDTDKDGLNDREEIEEYDTNPTDWDTDGDDLGDGDEVNVLKTDPLKIDTDGDFVPDGKEVEVGTDPNVDDTDGDLFPDCVELYFEDVGLDPTRFNWEHYAAGAGTLTALMFLSYRLGRKRGEKGEGSEKDGEPSNRGKKKKKGRERTRAETKEKLAKKGDKYVPPWYKEDPLWRKQLRSR